VAQAIALSEPHGGGWRPGGWRLVSVIGRPITGGRPAPADPIAESVAPSSPVITLMLSSAAIFVDSKPSSSKWRHVFL
jgi:hypothetical protein